MAVPRPENLEMKIPALLHLSRLGYGFLSGAQLRARDRGTNLVPSLLLPVLSRLNGAPVPPETFARLLEDLRSRLDAPDLGRRFYQTLREGWNGLRLIDFDRPERNVFHAAAELACGKGAGCFRPDITLFVNGLPLAMIELKRHGQARSLRAEYDRMLARFGSREARPYLQCTQVWAFSDDCADDPDRFWPTEGTWFAAVMAEEFPVYAVRVSRFTKAPLLPRNPEEEARILGAHGLKERPRTRAFRASLSPSRPTHRMLTALFAPENFLFLLRYGIQYLREEDAPGRVRLTRRMLSLDQLTLLKALRRKAERGYRNWTVPACGAAGEEALSASMVALLRDLYPASRLVWISADAASLSRERQALRSCGLPCVPSRDAARAKAGAVVIVPAEEAQAALSREAGTRKAEPPPVVILPSASPAFQAGPRLSERLRREHPAALLLARSPRPAAESLAGPGGGMLGFSLQFVSENGCETGPEMV